MANDYCGIETLYQTQLHSSFFLVAASVSCQKLLVIQIVRATETQGIKVRMC